MKHAPSHPCTPDLLVPRHRHVSAPALAMPGPGFRSPPPAQHSHSPPVMNAAAPDVASCGGFIVWRHLPPRAQRQTGSPSRQLASPTANLGASQPPGLCRGTPMRPP
eukprot:scaffold26_cov118-Isochrysis_galbana.AAC.1